jgi:iron-sulfur cluster insertion protein
MENHQLGRSESTTMTLTESAIRKLKTLLSDQEPGTMFRIFVQGGGCSGFEYGFNFETEKDDLDWDLEFDGVTVIVDNMSWMYLNQVTVDYQESLMQSGFNINNPIAVSQCGCGHSFAV